MIIFTNLARLFTPASGGFEDALAFNPSPGVESVSGLKSPRYLGFPGYSSIH